MKYLYIYMQTYTHICTRCTSYWTVLSTTWQIIKFPCFSYFACNLCKK